MNMNEKRIRGKNYTEEEKKNLVDIVGTYINIIECKKTDNKSVKQKHEAWEEIANEFNANCSTGPRSGQQIKLLYESIKKNAKKNVAKGKVELYKTGGGSCTNTVDLLGVKVLKLSGQDHIDHKNIYDSTAPLDILIDNVIEAPEDCQDTMNESFDELDFEHEQPSKTINSIHQSIMQNASNLSAKSPIGQKNGFKRKIDNYNTEKEKEKLAILKCRREQETIERDILLLQKQEMMIKIELLQLELEEKRQKVTKK